MTAQPFRLKRAVRGVAILASTVLGAGLSVGPLAQAASPAWGGCPSCPAAESLVPGTAWHSHTLAPGVMLIEGDKTDQNGRGLVKMHVLRIAIGTPGLSVKPLVHAVAHRSPLSQLAAGHPHLVAAVNTGYFDFETGAPTQPLIVDSQPLVIAGHFERVIGTDAAGAVEYGRVRLAATLYDGRKSYQLSGVNEAANGDGIRAYNAAWGSEPVPSGWSFQAAARPVVSSKLGSNAGRDAHVPQGGYELDSHGSSATSWLTSLASGSTAGLAAKVRSTTKQPFVNAIGVGAEIVKQHGQTRNDLPCNSANTLTPARTAIGVADDNKVLVIGEVEDHPGTNVHGLDENGMSGFMAQLGVDHAFLLDGSGSTELLAQMPGTSGLTPRTYPADGKERPMPVGLGISSIKPKVVKHHHHKKS